MQNRASGGGPETVCDVARQMLRYERSVTKLKWPPRRTAMNAFCDRGALPPCSYLLATEDGAVLVRPVLITGMSLPCTRTEMVTFILSSAER